jgi:flagellin FlaB
LRDQRGITGLETAIVLIAFAALSTGLFSSDKSKETIHTGLSETRGSTEVRGSVQAEATLTTKSLTTVTAEAVGTGDGADTSFTLDNSAVLTNSETVYVAAVAKTRTTDYTINFSTGAITFTAAPANGAAVTADYQHGQDYVGAAVTSTTSMTLTNTPIIPGTGLTVYLDGTAKALGTDYAVDYDTGVVTFTSGPGNGVRFDATYTYYQIDKISLNVANAAGGRPVDFTAGQTLITYRDNDTLVGNISDYILTRLGNSDSDNLLETNEMFQIQVDVSAYGLTNNDDFSIEVSPPKGAVVVTNRTIPASIDARMDLG